MKQLLSKKKLFNTFNLCHSFSLSTFLRHFIAGKSLTHAPEKWNFAVWGKRCGGIYNGHKSPLLLKIFKPFTTLWLFSNQQDKNRNKNYLLTFVLLKSITLLQNPNICFSANFVIFSFLSI